MNFINLAELIDASRSLNEYENSKKKINNNNLFIEEIFEDLFNNKKFQKIKYIILLKI
jgi:phosphoenolpyruvate carboxylase